MIDRVRHAARTAGLVLAVTGFLVGMAPTKALADATSGGQQASWLPLLRWANAVASIHTHYGVGATTNVGDPFLTAVAAFFFQVSALLWQVLGNLVDAAQGAGAVKFTVGGVDPIYATIGHGLLGTEGTRSLVVVVILAAAGMVAYRSFKAGHGATGALKGLFGVLLPVAVLVVTVNAATADGRGAPRGSPAWLITRTTGWVDATSGSVADAFLHFAPVAPAGVDHGQDTQMADCNKYMQGLDNRYLQQASAPGSALPRWQAANTVVLSRLWQAAVLEPWITAQFGAGPLGQKAFCHLLEIQAGVSAGHQVEAMAGDTPTGPYSAGQRGPTWSQLVAQPNPPGGTDGYHRPHYLALLGPDFANGDDDLRRNLIAWATCDYVGSANHGGWSVDPAFLRVFENPPGDDKGTCSTWWEQGTTKPPPTGGSLTVNGPFDFDDENAIQHATNAQGYDSLAARNYIQGLNGRNAGLAVSTSILALVSSVTYAWSLGGLAIGVLIGKLSLIILVACAPIFLLMAAIPSETTRTAARRAAGLTFAALLSTFTFSILMGLLLMFIGVLQAMTLDLFKADATFGALIQGLVPLAALYLLRKLLRRVGMESITSFRGAIKTTASFGQMGVRTVTGGWRPPPGPAGNGDRDRSGRSAPVRAQGLDSERRLPDATRPALPPVSLSWNQTWHRLLDPAPASPGTGPLERAPGPERPLEWAVGLAPGATSRQALLTAAPHQKALTVGADARHRPATAFPVPASPHPTLPADERSSDPDRVVARYGDTVDGGADS